jgi:hypothetical protein
MTHEQVVEALLALGFTSGWVVTDGVITLWENDEPQPTESQLEAAS